MGPLAFAWTIRRDHLVQSTPSIVGAYILGPSLVAFAAVCSLHQNFWQPVPEALPFRAFWLHASSGLIALSGLGLMFGRTRRLAALALIVIFSIFAAGFLPRVTSYPNLVGAWLGFAELLTIVAGVVAIWLQQSSASQPGALRVALRLFYVPLAVEFGLAHLFSLPETVALVPVWMPGTREFWAIITAFGHFGVALALLANWQVIPASRSGAVMYAGMGNLVWVPIIAQSPQNWLLWSFLVLSLAMAGALWSVGDFVGRRAFHIEPTARDPFHDAY